MEAELNKLDHSDWITIEDTPDLLHLKQLYTNMLKQLERQADTQKKVLTPRTW